MEESKFIQYPSDQGLLAPAQEVETLKEGDDQVVPDSVEPVKVKADESAVHKTSITLQLGFVPEEEEAAALKARRLYLG